MTKKSLTGANKHGGTIMKAVSRIIMCQAIILAMFAFEAQAADVASLVQPCGMCHGPDGNSTNPTIPAIAGITIEYFKHTMDAYKNGGRKSEMMKNFVHSLTDADINQIAGYFNKQKHIAREQQVDAVLAEKGKMLHEKYCIKCHENGGRITENNYGNLAGQWMPYLKQAISAYLDGSRTVNPMMITKLKALKEAEGEQGIDQIVNYYASVK